MLLARELPQHALRVGPIARLLQHFLVEHDDRVGRQRDRGTLASALAPGFESRGCLVAREALRICGNRFSGRARLGDARDLHVEMETDAREHLAAPR